jgi:hypothetical protein
VVHSVAFLSEKLEIHIEDQARPPEYGNYILTREPNEAVITDYPAKGTQDLT